MRVAVRPRMSVNTELTAVAIVPESSPTQNDDPGRVASLPTFDAAESLAPVVLIQETKGVPP
jgi:hypothetical protein